MEAMARAMWKGLVLDKAKNLFYQDTEVQPIFNNSEHLWAAQLQEKTVLKNQKMKLIH